MAEHLIPSEFQQLKLTRGPNALRNYDPKAAGKFDTRPVMVFVPGLYGSTLVNKAGQAEWLTYRTIARSMLLRGNHGHR